MEVDDVDFENYVQDDTNNHTFEDGNSSNFVEPKVGMTFTAIDEAYKFYFTYAGRKGFNARKSHNKKNKEGFMTRISMCCSMEGFRAPCKQVVNVAYRRPTSRVGCKAEMSCLLQEDGSFMIVSFQANHNHDLVSSPMKHMLKVNRKISVAQKSHMDDADKAGLSIKATLDLMSTENGGLKNLGFLGKDYKNYIYHKRKLDMGKGDAGAVMGYFQKMRTSDPSFFDSVQLDEGDMITNIFWADTRSINDYKLFGDVVCFDDTNLQDETFVDRSETNDPITPIGVKKKVTVGRPKGRFKDPLEKKKPKFKAKSTKASKNKALSVPDTPSPHHVAQDEVHRQPFNAFDGLLQESHNHIGSSRNDGFVYSPEIFGVNMNCENRLSFTQLLQSSMVPHRFIKENVEKVNLENDDFDDKN